MARTFVPGPGPLMVLHAEWPGLVAVFTVTDYSTEWDFDAGHTFNLERCQLVSMKTELSAEEAMRLLHGRDPVNLTIQTGRFVYSATDEAA